MEPSNPRSFPGSGDTAAAGTALSRREFVRSAAAVAAAGAAACNISIPRLKPTDIEIQAVSFGYEEFLYRAPYVFGGRSVDRATILNVTCSVRTKDGRSAEGRGSMPLGNVWSFPSKTMSYETTLNAMKELAQRVAAITSSLRLTGHPLTLHKVLEPEYLKAAEAVSRELKLASPIPKLCTLVTASPFDAALHDAYGKALGVSAFAACGRDLVNYDLEQFLGRDFRGEHLDTYVRRTPVPRIFVFHSVGAGDPITEADITTRLNDGLPETLAEWIEFNGIRRIKIKLNGQDLAGDVDRTVRIDRVAEETLRKSGVDEWYYCLDFNENCRSADFVVDFLNRFWERRPTGFQKVLYVEQPTPRDLKAHRANVMHKAAKMRAVVIDESLTDLESLLLAREMGYTGIALKACKGQSQAMLMAAAGRKYGMFLCVQDLTCPGAALIHSAGIAAHVPGNSGIEANARQYVPAANQPWVDSYPGIFRITDGTMHTAGLTGPGLGVA